MANATGFRSEPGSTVAAPQSVNAATSPSTQPAPAAAATPASTDTSTPGLTGTNLTNQQSASAQISSFLSQIPGLATLDPSGALAAWMNGQASTMAGQGIDSSTIVNTIESTMNNPSGDPAAQQVFDQLFPGYNQKITNGTTNSDGSYTGLAGYIQYAAQIQQFSNQAGLAPGTISAQSIGQLWAGDVSASEVSQRVTDAYSLASNTPQAVQDYLSNNYGLSTGSLASYFLNPTNTITQITNTMNAGMVGGLAATSGFNQSLSTAQAQAVGAFLANGAGGATGSAVGTPNQVTQQQASNFFGGNIGGNVSGSAAQLAGLETATPGQNATSTTSENELLSALGVPGEGTTQAQALVGVSNAQQTRTAGARGGGGASTTSNGAAGLGFAQS